MSGLKHYCPWCGHTGLYSGPGPHSCPGCDQFLNKALSENAIDALMSAAFDRPRDPRSAEYKAGTRAALVKHVQGDAIVCPHAPGTPQADAFFSGIDEGHGIWRAKQAKAQG